MDIAAADLPAGSIVATKTTIYARETLDEPSLPWQQMDIGGPWVNYADDDEVDEKLTDGAVVLRHGYGEG